MDAVAQKLADGSRDVAWRRPLGDSGILEFSLKMLQSKDGHSQALQLQCLRLIGNACADTDENRARVVDQDHGLACIIRRLSDENLAPVAVPVLLNVLMDYAQRTASQAGLSRDLVSLLSRSSDPSDVVLHVCRVLELLVQQEGEPAIAEPSTVDLLLDLAARTPADDEEQLMSLVEVAAAYLASLDFQTSLVSGSRMSLFLDVFHRLHTLPPSEDEPRLKRLRSSILTTLADVSGNDSFATHHPPSSPVHQTLLAWIRGADAGLQSAACLALGNLSRSDEASIGLVERDAIVIPLAELLSNPDVSNSQLLHLALSFGRNLAIPVPNKIKLGPLLDPSCVPRVLAMDTLPQVQLPAVSLVRLLLLNCPSNVSRMCRRWSDDSSPSPNTTGIATVISLFNRSDAEPTKVEASRCILALCRALYSISTAASDILVDWFPSASPSPTIAAPDDESSRRRRLFHQSHNLSRPLSFLLPQRKWPALRSETWFVLALMSRYPDGAEVVAAVLASTSATEALTETITGRSSSTSSPPLLEDSSIERQSHHLLDSSSVADMLHEPRPAADPEQGTGAAKADRENAIVLASELLCRGEEGLTGEMLALLRRLVQEGAQQVAAQRAVE
ncbi:hypothetical protein CDD80_253 [Ophiocordyceps camponoti-rufipedis]|uniref:UNC-45/Cro1/She4 central domain-containing protein n=1 Tax=Ophiocordyceps camponoti-rufipedis TaxID=2004952 RepID=A0A2C5XPW4_9HYPO|nr:hypothetical protein CDD80_253 [Ophiocordyceps camponoti-rufipedis]